MKFKKEKSITSPRVSDFGLQISWWEYPVLFASSSSIGLLSEFAVSSGDKAVIIGGSQISTSKGLTVIPRLKIQLDFGG